MFKVDQEVVEDLLTIIAGMVFRPERARESVDDAVELFPKAVTASIEYALFAGLAEPEEFGYVTEETQ